MRGCACVVGAMCNRVGYGGAQQAVRVGRGEGVVTLLCQVCVCRTSTVGSREKTNRPDATESSETRNNFKFPTRGVALLSAVYLYPRMTQLPRLSAPGDSIARAAHVKGGGDSRVSSLLHG